MINNLYKNKILFTALLWLFVGFLFSNNALAETASPIPRNADIDMAKVNTYLRFGNYVADEVIRSMGFRGTGFATSPVNADQIFNEVAGEWVFGPPAGITNYSSDMVTDLVNKKVLSKEEAQLLRSIAPVAMGAIPTQSKDSFSSADPYEKGKITQPDGGVTNVGAIALSDANNLGVTLRLFGAATAYRDQLEQAAGDYKSALPEQKGIRDIGKNSDSTGMGTSGSPFVGVGETVIPAAAKVSQLALTTGGWLSALMTGLNPDGGEVAVNTGKMPSNLSLAKAEKSVSSAQVTGTGEFAGTSAQVAGLTSERPGSSLGNLADITRLASQNTADQINNRANQLGNAQNRFPNGRLNQLANQFSPDQLTNLLANRFSGAGSTQQPTPSATQTASNTNECDPAKAVLSQQEVLDIADLLGLPIGGNSWTTSYFKAQQLIGQAVYLNNASTLTIISSATIPDTQACIWVTYAPSVKKGVFTSDVRSTAGTKFMFTMP